MAKVRKYKTPSGKTLYMVDFSVTLGKDFRKREREWGFESKAEAEAFAAELRLRPLDRLLDYSKIIRAPLDEAIDNYLKTVSRNKVSKDGEIVYFERMKDCLKKEKGFDGYVDSITYYHMQTLQNYLADMEYTRGNKPEDDLKNYRIRTKTRMTKDGPKTYTTKEKVKRKRRKKKTLSNSTINRHFNTYRNFFEECRFWKYLRTNPCEFLEDRPEDENKIKVWPAQAVMDVLRLMRDFEIRIVYFLAKTGARRKEAVILEPKDIDTTKPTWTVTLKSRKGDGGWREREVALTDEMKAFISEQLIMAKQNKWQYLFTDENGDQVDRGRLSTALHRAAIAAGWAGFNLHGLRHTFATQLMANNTNIRKIQGLLGHRNIKTTEKYTHSNTEMQRKDLEALEDSYRIELPVGPGRKLPND